MNLDVGCGWNFKGDVNVDLFLHRNIMDRQAEQTRYRNHKAYDKQVIPNLVCADCHHLPFRDNSFTKVFCSHLLEHKGVDAVETCKELLRVANGKLELSVPSQVAQSAHAELHDKAFTRSAFHLMFKQFKRKVTFQRFTWKFIMVPKTPMNVLHAVMCHPSFHGFPNPLHKLPCPVPTEIMCEVWKHQPRFFKLFDGTVIRDEKGIIWKNIQ